MRGSLAIMLALLLAQVPKSANAACPIVNLLTGDMSLAEVTIAPEPPYDGYKTYLIRNNARDKQGILNNWIKAELVPERWGFDVVLPNGDRIGQVNVFVREPTCPRNDFCIDGANDACASHALALRLGEPPATVSVIDHGKEVGTIVSFPHKLLK